MYRNLCFSKETNFLMLIAISSQKGREGGIKNTGELLVLLGKAFVGNIFVELLITAPSLSHFPKSHYPIKRHGKRFFTNSSK